MSKKTEANLYRIKKLENEAMIYVPSASGYGDRSLEINKVVRMIIDHLGLAYEPGIPTSSNLVKVLKK